MITELMSVEEFEQMAVEVRDGDTKAPRIPTMRRIVAAYRAALERIAALKAGQCLKCGMGPMRESCAYPEACEHPGRALAGEYGQAVIGFAAARDALNSELTRLRAEIKNLEDVRDMVCRNCDNLEAERDTLKARVAWLERGKRFVAAWIKFGADIMEHRTPETLRDMQEWLNQEPKEGA